MADFTAKIAELRETHRMHQALVRSCVRLQLQIQSIERRVRESITSTDVPGQSATEVAPLPDREVSPAGQPPELSDPSSTESGVPPAGKLSVTDHPRVESTDEEEASILGLSTDGVLGGPTEERATPVDRLSPADALSHLATLPLQAAIDGLRVHELKLRKRMVKLVRELPVACFVDDIKGFAHFGLAQIVAEAGDLGKFSNPAKFWKRMGLAVIDGRGQRRVGGAQAMEHGYSPARRSIMFVLGESLIKWPNRYRQIYLDRKAFELAKAPDLTKGHVHLRAHRYMEKRLLRDLWSAWRRTGRIEAAA